jgi:catechol 2,3-dioxygenase-like lactoylglutathione lyase family enzyme
MTTKRTPQIGDVFAVHTSGSEGLLGRVVSTSAIVGPTHGCHLVYIYRPGAGLSRDDLLIPPLLTTRAPWTHRYFEFLRSEPLLPGDFFERHAFRDDKGQLYDEECRPLQVASSPVGEWRLLDVAAIETAIAAGPRRHTALPAAHLQPSRQGVPSGRRVACTGSDVRAFTEANLTVMVADIDRAVDFYTAKLGFSPGARHDHHYAEVKAPGVTVVLHPHRGSVVRGGSLSIGLRVEDMAVAAAKLARSGLSLTFQENEANKFAFFEDPDGTSLYLFQVKRR